MKKLIVIITMALVSFSAFAQDITLEEEGKQILRELGYNEENQAQANQWTEDYINRLLAENEALKNQNADLTRSNGRLAANNIDLICENTRLEDQNIILRNRNYELAMENTEIREMYSDLVKSMDETEAALEELREMFGDSDVESSVELIRTLKAWLSYYMTNEAGYKAFYVKRDEMKEAIHAIFSEKIVDSWLYEGNPHFRMVLEDLDEEIMEAFGENILAPAPSYEQQQ